MKKHFPFQNVIIIIISILPLIYLGYEYNLLPESVPTHFGFDGKPNQYSSKSELLILLIFISVISIGIYFLTKNLSTVDPKRTAKLSSDASQKIGFGVVIFLSAISIMIISVGLNPKYNFMQLFTPLIGLFFIYVGNLMHSIKPNYFIGIRVPWTLEDPNNWRATHQLGSKLWVAGGILITILSLILPQKLRQVAFLIVTAIIVLIPVGYSFIYFQKNKPQK